MSTSSSGRGRRIAIIVIALAALQGLAILLYRARGAEDQSAPPRPTSNREFVVERLADPLAVGELVLERADRTRWTVADAKGRPVLLHFWATWCGPCRHELPALLGQAARIRKLGVELVLVSVDEDWSEIHAFFGGVAPPEVSRTLSNDYRKITSGILPETLVVDEQGRAERRMRGERAWASPQAVAFLESLR